MDTNKEKNFASAVVYCFNCESTIGQFLEELDNQLTSNFLKHEIIVVNDFSRDNSVQVVKEYARLHEGSVITLLNMSVTWGPERSVIAGVDLSIGDFVFEFDNPVRDFDWSLMMEVYNKSLQGYDIVNSVSVKQPNFKQRLFYRYFNHYAGLRYPIENCTFRVLSRRAINRTSSLTQTIPVRKIAYAKSGLSVTSVKYKPIVEGIFNKYDRDLSNAMTAFLLFTDVGYSLTAKLACFMALVCLLSIVGTFAYFVVTTTVNVPILSFVIISFFFAGMFAILTIVVSYLKTISSLVFRKKDYIFESIEKLN